MLLGALDKCRVTTTRNLENLKTGRIYYDAYFLRVMLSSLQIYAWLGGDPLIICTEEMLNVSIFG